jgi:integrase
MAKLDKRLTDSLARALRGPETESEKKATYVVHWCRDTPGLGLRVTNTGDRAFVSERRVNGKTVRRTLGKAPGGKATGAISTDTARKLLIEVSSELQTGVDRVEIKREKRKEEKIDAVTFEEALKVYLEGKRRAKDGLPLKERTKSDYVKMITAGGTKKDGTPFLDGLLVGLAHKAITRITADDIRKTYSAAEKRGARVATYSMQVLRAVLNWHGIQVDESPLAKTTAGKDRIILKPTAGNPDPIRPETLGAWWNAAMEHAGGSAADGCRFVLLTGCRPGEVFGDAFGTGILKKDVDFTGGRLKLIDTKNRKDHEVVLSTQALDILKVHCKGKKRDAKVFDIDDPGKTLDNINSAAKSKRVTPNKLRHTFASIAAALVNAFVLKRMMNHTDSSEVTATFYVLVTDDDLRNGWQAVADFIESRAKATL